MFLSKWKAIFIKIKPLEKLYYETIHKKQNTNMDLFSMISSQNILITLRK